MLFAAPALPAQAAPIGALEFLGFRPGSSGAEAESLLADLGGRWQCRRARADRRLAECRGTLRRPPDGELTLTASLVNDSVAILLIAGPIGEEGLARWRDALGSRFGPTPVARRDHDQDSWQWVRRRRMIRLTTRREGGRGGRRMVSVSLVDGPLLDGLGASPP